MTSADLSLMRKRAIRIDGLPEESSFGLDELRRTIVIHSSVPIHQAVRSQVERWVSRWTELAVEFVAPWPRKPVGAAMRRARAAFGVG